MRVTIFGSGYVGLVTGACLAEAGNDVLCVDIDREKIARLEQGELPIYEPGLDSIVERVRKSARLSLTTVCFSLFPWEHRRMRMVPRICNMFWR